MVRRAINVAQFCAMITLRVFSMATCRFCGQFVAVLTVNF